MSSSNDTELNLKINQESEIRTIPGLIYMPEYLSIGEQKQLLNTIDQQEWSIKVQRRVQHYGYQYDYKNGEFASSRYLGELPNWLGSLVNRFCYDGLTKKGLDQVIINEYAPGQGIVNHTDCIPCFGNTIITLSLGSSCVMKFTHSQTYQKVKILLEPGSVLVFQKAARYEWEHGIAERDRDRFQGKELVRTRRVSLTFREVLFPYK